MQTLAWKSVDRCAEYLDFVRSRFLRVTLKISGLRPVFYTRWLRLAAFFSMACVNSLLLALILPLWLLLIGPLVYGVPHIFASIRYFHHSLAGLQPESQLPRPAQTRRLAFATVGFLLLAVSSYRIFVTLNILGIQMPQLSEWRGSTYIELLALLATFVLGALIYRKSILSVIKGVLFLAPFGLGFWFKPMWTIGAMVLIHNFVAFAYWIRSCSNRAEKSVAWSATAVTSILTAAIFMGAFDWVYLWIHPAQALDIARLSVEDTGKLIAPWSSSPSLWLHACIAFGFGQSLHYFVWLKAIPDQYHYHDVPTSFRQSLGLLSQDFGKTIAVALIVLSLGAIVLWSFMSFQQARLIYFCLAAYHGYLEIAGLALSFKNKEQRTKAELNLL